ncbi:MAG: DUF1015 domain-containing protein [Elusimicrobiota bacterium]
MDDLNEKTGVKLSVMLLPGKSYDLTKWSVVACDQFTSQPEYWAAAAKTAGKSPSTLNLIYPEAFLNEDQKKKEERINGINAAMKKYLESGVLAPLEPCFIYVDRKTAHVKSRKGLVLTVDLEKYDFSKGSQSLIRSTEKTVVERIPPRLKIREKATIELSHTMLLIDDPEKTVIEPLGKQADKMKLLYDFDLMQNGGHLKGYMAGKQEAAGALAALEKLADPEAFRAKYGAGADKGVLLFAVGDGNHSLATAKTHWENIKKTLSAKDTAGHPGRFAMVEVVNVHDSGLQFEPIHRIVFNVDCEKMLKEMTEHFEKNGMKASFEIHDAIRRKRPKSRAGHAISFIAQGKMGVLAVKNPKFNLAVGTLQDGLDAYAAAHPGTEIDYIHGNDVVQKLSNAKGNIGFLMPAMDKNELFRTVILEGTLPRKTFSMGEADEKRYYLECRRITAI